VVVLLVFCVQLTSPRVIEQINVELSMTRLILLDDITEDSVCLKNKFFRK
jgi:hypothetical protein